MPQNSLQDIPTFKTKPHIAVLTDICNEPDDAESLTRFLLYANEFQIDALIATTSFWQQSSTHIEQIHQIIDAYAGVEAALNGHVPPDQRMSLRNLPQNFETMQYRTKMIPAPGFGFIFQRFSTLHLLMGGMHMASLHGPEYQESPIVISIRVDQIQAS